MKGDGQLSELSAVALSIADTSALKRIHSGPHHKLYRGRTAEGSVVVKVTASELPAPHAVASMRHEYELLRDLELPGIVRVLGLTPSAEGLALVMADAGPGNLAEVTRSGPVPVADFLEIAVQLAEAVARLHEARVVHRDINPGNVVWDAGNRRATLCDFGIATTLSLLTVENATPKQLEGTLAYISPEQTGRTGRTVDSRTDLYSLGASFYEMLTGNPPFGSADAVALVHAHIARRPAPPHEINAEMPRALSRIVLKLLEKEPEQRYQTAEALAADLREARSQWLRAETVAEFPLGRYDVPRELSIPDKLYGREEEFQTLRDTFARARRGGREFVLVTGGPGIGKSALVSHLGPQVTEHHGFYIAGKFDQLQRSVPFSGLAQAFRALVRQLLTQDEPALARWRERIQAAVAPNSQLLVEVVPELARLLGPQPAVPDFGPVESRNRFHLAFTGFLRVFAQPEHPLVLFLDDLQWIDAASLQLIEQWLGDTASHHLLLLGAYRDNEVGASHPLSLSLAALRDAGSALHEIRLGPIGGDDIAQLAAEAFNQQSARTGPLADLIVKKTAGNPFFVRRLLHLLHAEGFIRYLPDSHRWAWDVAELERAPAADNVLDLMVQAMERLPEATRALLEAGACIGHSFDLGTLAAVTGRSRTAATDELWPALEDGLLLPVREAYKAPRRAGPLEGSLDALPGVVEFAHDRVQQAAYSLLSEEHRREIHLTIGRHWLHGAADGQLEERLFEIVDQLDLGEALIADPAERLRLVELNLTAGRKAKASAAYQAACDYLSLAMHHLPERPWDERPEVTFALHRELAECAYLTGQHATAEELTETALEHAPSQIAKADLYSLRVLAATVAGDWLRALRWGREGLAVFGLEWSREGLAAATEAETSAVMKNVGERRIEDLVDEPEVADEETRAAMRLLSILGPPAYFSGDEALAYLVTRATNLSLVHGPSPYSAYAYVFYGALHNARTGEYDVGYAFGRLALALASRFGNRAEDSRMLEVFGLVVHPWKAPLRDSLPLVREGFRAGVESGELAYAAFNLNSVLINGLPAGMPLPDILADADVAIDFATRHKNRTSIEMAVPFRQISRALMGATRAPASFDDDEFEEARFLEKTDNQTALGFFWVARLRAAFLVGDYETARRSSRAGAGPVLAGNLGMMTTVEHVFYTALTLAAECDRGSGDEQGARLHELRALHRKLARWAEYCPENFAHKAALVGAEIARLSRAPLEAMKLYRTAIEDARRQLFIQDEALAHELRARFFLGEHEPELAAVHFRTARERYHHWGATVKVRALERERPECFSPEPRTRERGISIDAMALIKASQAISAETAPARLFERILRVAVEVAGAQRGALILCETDALTVRARIEAVEEISVSLSPAPLEECIDLPSAILHYVVRLKEPLVLSDAAAEGAFAADRAVRRRKLRSVLCVPLMKQAKVVGLLYLENDTMAGAFADDFVEVVQTLAAQAVISLENSTLLAELQQLTGELEKHVAERTRQLTDQIAARDEAEAALRQAQKMEVVGQLTGGVAHDFNNLLTVIRNSIALLRRADLPEDRRKRYIDAIAETSDRATRLTSQLLAFARRQTLTPEAFDAGESILAVRDMVGTITGARIKIVTEIPEQRCLVNTDHNQFDIAIINMVVNARDAMNGEGMLVIAVKRVSGVPSVRAQPSIGGDYVAISIADDGSGIPDEEIDRIFEPFFTTKEVGAGTGLGLSQVFGFAKQSGGEITVESKKGNGSTFTLYLPAEVDGSDTVDEAVEADCDVLAEGARVLVVEDNAEVGAFATEALAELGYEAVLAQDGAGALAELASAGERFDIVFSDVVMPGMSGIELGQKIRQQYPDLPVVLTSGYSTVLAEKGAHGFELLRKPYSLEDLVRVLHRVSARRDARPKR